MPASSRRYRTPRRRSAEQRLTTRQRWFVVFVAVLSSVSSVAAPVVAGVFVENSMVSNTEALGQGLVLLDYESGSHLTIDSQADWDTGVYATTQADAESAGNLTLAHHGDIPPTASAPWWNTAWLVRRCVIINNSGTATTEHPIELVIDTTSTVASGEMLATGADIRAVDSATGLELPLWIEGDNVPSAATEIWVQLATVPAGNSEVCLYSGNQNPLTPSVSDEQSVFTYTTPKIRHYTMGGGWAGATLSVVSYVDNNSVTVGGTTTVLNRGAVGTFAGVNQNTVVQSTGPISGTSSADPTDALMPESMAATSYVFAINRNTQTIWVRALSGSVTLQFQSGGAVINTTIVGSAAPPAATQVIASGTTVGITADALNGDGLLVESTGGQFLAVHDAAAGGADTDAVVGIPWLGEPLYGVRTRYLQVAAGAAATTYSALGSDGTNIVNQPVGATELVATNTNPVVVDRRGQGPAIRVTSAGPIVGATQYADENGSEITAFLPFSLLEHEYFLPIQANYVAIACPTPGQTITMTPPAGAPSTLTCTNPGGLAGAPGKAYVGIATFAAGTHFESADRFFLMMEKNAGSDEINVFGGKAARPRPATNPAQTIGQLEGLYRASGTWSGPTVDSGSSGVYGLLTMLGSTPPGSGASLQIATGSSAAAATGATPVGPDGTSATFYDTGSETINTIHDFEEFVRVVVTLSTTDPLVTPVISSIDISADLTELATASQALTVVNVDASPGLSSHLISRIYVTGTLSYTAEISYRDGTNLPAVNALTVRTDHPADHVRATAGAIVQGQGSLFAVNPGNTFSLFLDEDIAAGSVATVSVTLTSVETNGAILEHDIDFVLTSP